MRQRERASTVHGAQVSTSPMGALCAAKTRMGIKRVQLRVASGTQEALNALEGQHPAEDDPLENRAPQWHQCCRFGAHSLSSKSPPHQPRIKQGLSSHCGPGSKFASGAGDMNLEMTQPPAQDWAELTSRAALFHKSPVVLGVREMSPPV